MASPTDGSWDVVSGVGLTALAVAAARAVETDRPDALVRDRWAARFVGRARAPVPMPRCAADLGGSVPAAARQPWEAMADLLGVRSRFFDDFLTDATAAGVGQAVVLAAGLDSRAFRLPWPPGCLVFELDQAKVLAFKNDVLGAAEPGCARRAVPVDLRTDWTGPLLAAGFDPERPTAWLAEGLLSYLPASAEDLLFERVARLSAPASRLAASRLDVVRLGDVRHDDVRLGVDFASLLNREPRRPLDEHLPAPGWTTRAYPLVELGRRYGRPLSSTLSRALGKHARLVTAHRAGPTAVP